MPIYEYRCEACDTVFEEWHQHADDIMEQPCPKCAKEAHRLISNTSFVLKGGGWYVTEYGNKKSQSSETTPPSSAPASDAAPQPTKTTSDASSGVSPVAAKPEALPAKSEAPTAAAS